MDEIKGGLSRWIELIHSEDHNYFNKEIERLKTTGTVANLEYRIRKKDGEYIYVEDEGRFIEDASGKKVRMVGFVKNITERRQIEKSLKESEERFRLIFDNATDGILLADPESKRFFLGNKAICQKLGYSEEEIKNLGLQDIHPEEALPSIINDFEKQARREIDIAHNLPVKRKDGSVFYADINAFPVTIAGKKYLAGIFRDVTEKKKSEEALKNKMRQIEHLNNMFVGREMRMIELKKEVNALLEELGRPKEYMW
jgi:PAS domain S-box-containing protein